MNPNLLLAFWGVTFLLIVVPGPDWAFVLASGARDQVVLPAVSGLMLGYCMLTLLVAVGIGAIVGRSALLLTALTVVGAAYLVHLGISVLRNPGVLRAGPSENAVSAVRRMISGIGVSGLNPKGLLVFLAMLPQFTDANGAWPRPVQFMALGIVFTATCGVFYTLVGFGARTILSTKPAMSRTISRISGAAMIVVGFLLLIERVLSA